MLTSPEACTRPADASRQPDQAEADRGARSGEGPNPGGSGYMGPAGLCENTEPGPLAVVGDAVWGTVVVTRRDYAAGKALLRAKVENAVESLWEAAAARWR